MGEAYSPYIIRVWLVSSDRLQHHGPSLSLSAAVHLPGR